MKIIKNYENSTINLTILLEKLLKLIILVMKIIKFINK
jgi:hypothetical protein